MISFHFRSSMKGLKDSAVGNTVFQALINQQRKIESHAVPGHGVASLSARVAIGGAVGSMLPVIEDSDIAECITSLRQRVLGKCQPFSSFLHSLLCQCFVLLLRSKILNGDVKSDPLHVMNIISLDIKLWVCTSGEERWILGADFLLIWRIEALAALPCTLGTSSENLNQSCRNHGETGVSEADNSSQVLSSVKVL